MAWRDSREQELTHFASTRLAANFSRMISASVRPTGKWESAMAHLLLTISRRGKWARCMCQCMHKQRQRHQSQNPKRYINPSEQSRDESNQEVARHQNSGGIPESALCPCRGHPRVVSRCRSAADALFAVLLHANHSSPRGRTGRSRSSGRWIPMDRRALRGQVASAPLRKKRTSARDAKASAGTSTAIDLVMAHLAGGGLGDRGIRKFWPDVPPVVWTQITAGYRA